MQTDYRLIMAIRSDDLRQGQTKQLPRIQQMPKRHAAGVKWKRRYASYLAAATVVATVVGGLAIS